MRTNAEFNDVKGETGELINSRTGSLKQPVCPSDNHTKGKGETSGICLETR